MSVNFSLEGKIAFVTGASYGIGFAIASGMAKAGAKIVFNSFRYNKSLKPKKERNGNETGKSCLHSPLPGKGFIIIIEPVINEEIKECRMNFIL